MALSNWDSLAFDIHGPNVQAAATNASGHTIEIHKNWLYLHAGNNPRRWWNRSEPESTPLARIDHGDLNIGDWQITAVAGPQNGIYVVATSAEFSLADDMTGDHWHHKTLLVGCGVYGYDTEPVETDLGDIADTDAPWIGVMPSSVEFLRDLVTTYVDDSVGDGWPRRELQAIPWADALRRNQGDSYFKGAATAPGAAQPPVIEQIFRGVS